MSAALVGWKAWCALVLGAGLGVGGALAVKNATHRQVVANAKPARTAGRPPAPKPALQDCPVATGAGALPMLLLPEIPMPDGFGATEQGMPARLAPPSDGAWLPLIGLPPAVPPVSSSPASAVPEPATWAMLVVGFGLVGLLSRRSRLA